MDAKQFKALKDNWYKKLKKEGFKDIEQEDGNLTTWASRLFLTHYDEIKYQAKEEYYQLAGQFYHDYNFKSVLDKMIWELHITGMSIRNIVKTLKQKNLNVYRRKVHEIIMRLRNEMLTQCKK